MSATRHTQNSTPPTEFSFQRRVQSHVTTGSGKCSLPPDAVTLHLNQLRATPERHGGLQEFRTIDETVQQHNGANLIFAPAHFGASPGLATALAFGLTACKSNSARPSPTPQTLPIPTRQPMATSLPSQRRTAHPGARPDRFLPAPAAGRELLRRPAATRSHRLQGAPTNRIRRQLRQPISRPIQRRLQQPGRRRITPTRPLHRLPEYDQPPAPEPNYIWTPGYWAYGPEGYYWTPGVWCPPPYYGALWTPPYWGFYGGRYGFHHGYWGLHIGFYGGVDYGFGYIGIGYFGGYWHGQRLLLQPFRHQRRLPTSRQRLQPRSSTTTATPTVAASKPRQLQRRPRRHDVSPASR